MKKNFYLSRAKVSGSISPATSLAVFESSLRAYKNSPKLDDPKISELFLRNTEQQLQMRQEKVDNNRKRHTKLKQRFEKLEGLLKDAAIRLKEQRKQECVMEKASVKIQKVFRGFITRKKLEARVYGAKKEKMEANIGSMNDDKKFLMFNVGRMPEISASLIQKTYKRYKARCYFSRLLQTYKAIQQQKEEENFRNLKEKLCILICIRKKKQKAFERYRKQRLKAIKEKLALIKIKIIFKTLKLKKKVILDNIKKYKRRLRAAQKRRTQKIEALIKENPTLTQQDLEALENLSIGSEEDFETTTSDREAEERAELLRKLEADRKTRIHYAKLSHNLRDPKLPKILTSRHHHEVPFSEIKLPPARPPIKRRYSIIKDDLPIRRADGEEPSYMRATISFNLSKLVGKNDSFDEERVVEKGQVRNRSTLFEPTKASLLKISNKRSLSAEESVEEENYRKTLNKFISVKIRERVKSPVKRKMEASRTVIRRTEEVRDAFGVLPEISTKHKVFPIKVKARAGIMKGFIRSRKVGEQFFEF